MKGNSQKNKEEQKNEESNKDKKQPKQEKLVSKIPIIFLFLLIIVRRRFRIQKKYRRYG